MLRRWPATKAYACSAECLALACEDHATVRVLILSPHRDDGPLSVGGLIQRAPQHMTLLSVFSRTVWTRHHASAPGDVGAVTRMRAHEERQAARRLGGARVAALGFPEALLRGYREVCRPVAPERDPCFARVRDRIAAKLAESFDLVLLPLGVGGHIDHVLVSCATIEVARDLGQPLAFYEDIPYALDVSAASVTALARRRFARLDAVPVRYSVSLTMGELDRKVWALEAYRSQLDKGLLERIFWDAWRRPTFEERLFVPRGAPSDVLDLLRAPRFGGSEPCVRS